MNIPSLGSPKFAKFAKATATTVYLMTLVKATVRPAFNLADKKSDKESRKYSALNEFLYQVVCLGFAAAMIPLAERGGFKLAESQFKKVAELEQFKKLSDIPMFSKIKKLGEFKKEYLEKTFDDKFVKKLEAIEAKAKAGKVLTKDDKETLAADKAMHLVNGGVETGSFLASILGLTILAPMIGHELLHPIMKHLGKCPKEDKEDIGTPADLYLADAKVPEEKGKKVNKHA